MPKLNNSKFRIAKKGLPEDIDRLSIDGNGLREDDNLSPFDNSMFLKKETIGANQSAIRVKNDDPAADMSDISGISAFKTGYNTQSNL